MSETMTLGTTGLTLRLEGDVLPDRKLIGGKAWSLARMQSLGLPTPPGFVITTEACLRYLAQGALPAGLEQEIADGIAWLEQKTGRAFGAGPKSLLVSVRSGAAISMPGMMDTVLNLGITDETEQHLAQESGSPAFAHDTHRRFCELYPSIVMKAPAPALEPDAPSSAWRQRIAEAAGRPMPDTPVEQLLDAVRAVFDSWNTRRAKRYREHNGIPHDLGTAVTVQAMVFGNLDDRSGTGVLFSRDPLTGERRPYGEYLPRAQGEDVVSGKQTPLPLATMEQQAPEALSALLAAAERLEQVNGDVQDIEFTVQNRALFLLQARSAKRAPQAAVRIAVEMVQEGLIDPVVALGRVTPEQVRTLLSPQLRDGAAQSGEILASGEGACPGVGIGLAVDDPDEAERRAAAGEDVILVRETTSPDDVHGMIAARAVITEQGGSTSHAAVVSRALGRPCIVGCGASARSLIGRVITADGQAGLAYAGALAVVSPDERSDPSLSKLVAWARTYSPVAVWRPEEPQAPADGVDLDAVADGFDVEKLRPHLAGAATARGAVLANEAAALAAADCGVRTLVTQPVLPVLLSLAARAVAQDLEARRS